MFEKLTDQQLQKIKGGTSLQPRSMLSRNDNIFVIWKSWLKK